MEWFRLRCDGEWEHGNGIVIETLDNPGWSLKIELKGTPLEGKPLPADQLDSEGIDYWWMAKIENGLFCAFCGPHDLPAVLKRFRSWAENSD